MMMLTEESVGGMCRHSTLLMSLAFLHYLTQKTWWWWLFQTNCALSHTLHSTTTISTTNPKASVI